MTSAISTPMQLVPSTIWQGCLLNSLSAFCADEGQTEICSRNTTILVFLLPLMPQWITNASPMFRAASSLRIKPVPPDYHTSRSALTKKCRHSQSLLEGSSCEQYRARSGFFRSTRRWGLELLSLPNSIAFCTLFHLVVNARDLSSAQACNRRHGRSWNILRCPFVNADVRPGFDDPVRS